MELGMTWGIHWAGQPWRAGRISQEETNSSIRSGGCQLSQRVQCLDLEERSRLEV